MLKLNGFNSTCTKQDMLEPQGDIEAYPCRLCNSGFLDEADLHEHVKAKHAASYANDPRRAFVEYRKKVLGLVMAGGPQAGWP